MCELVKVDPASPSGLVWVQPKAKRCKVGSTAGSLTSHGYWVVVLNYKKHYAHRLVWELTYGTIPPNMQVDHIDRDRGNNKLSNLRLVSLQDNNLNKDVYSTNKTGVRNVHLNSKGTYTAQVKYRGKVHSKNFHCLEEAKLWVLATRKRLNPHYAN